MNRKDPFKYFRIEARELSDALTKDALELEKSPSPKETIAKLLRHAHTLKGAARVMKLTAIADLAHAMEETLAPFREGTLAVPRTVPDRILGFLDDLTLRLAELDSPNADAPKIDIQPADARRWDTVRLELADVDSVLERMSEATSQLALLKQEMTGLDRIRRLSNMLMERAGNDSPMKRRSALEELNTWLDRFHRVSGEALDQAERDLRLAHERVERLRLIPAASLLDFLERAVRDAARTLGQEVRFERSGGGHRMDAPVLSSLQEALLHIVRNAVTHGVEKKKARIDAGKSPEGVVRIEVARRGSLVFFTCSDDGGGIDPAEVRRLAIARGLLPDSATDPWDLQDAVRVLLRGGISSSEKVSEFSGRGIGLDAVRETVERLHGGIRVESRVGQGTQVEIQVPYSMSTFPALAVEADGVLFLIPFECVRKAIRILESGLARAPEGDTIFFEGHALPMLPLEGIFPPNLESARRSRPGVVVESALGMAVLGVDRILGVRETVARPLPSLACSNDIVAGASLDVEGNPYLVLDPVGLVKAARGRKGESLDQAAPLKPVILVVDDSLTTRMLEQSILESAGYAVECAVSGEEALIRTRQTKYSLFLVDVEMPGMDGFMLLEKFREDAGLRDIPAILVTSRSSKEDRRRAESVGARDHIVKGEFDQARLLGRIKELLG
jgi:two-component system, chemotaxis family, sensor kinase CheA